MNIIVVGDHSSPNKTAAAIATGFMEADGDAAVTGYPEASRETWRDLGDPAHLADVEADVIVWSKSRPLSRRYDQNAMLDAAAQAGVTTVSFHLDRWWGLGRQTEVETDPFFQSDLVVTTDGGNDRRWAAAGVEHRWLPPATLTADTVREAGLRPDAAGKVVFVGSWQAYAHREWSHRGALIKRLRRRFGGRMVTFPREDGRRVVGQELADIIASAAVVVGDSALPSAATHYWSDRVPITLGMGGLLVHPVVDGMHDQGLIDGEHYIGAPVGDIDAFGDVVADALAGRYDSARIRSGGRAAVIEGHTYAVRARQILDLVAEYQSSNSGATTVDEPSDPHTSTGQSTAPDSALAALPSSILSS